jgi:hypothetical protein
MFTHNELFVTEDGHLAYGTDGSFRIIAMPDSELDRALFERICDCFEACDDIPNPVDGITAAIQALQAARPFLSAHLHALHRDGHHYGTTEGLLGCVRDALALLEGRRVQQ